ncbi:MAG: DMT family transporter [Rhodobacteraceae bacterium]|nr:DMT family transporter [Paracoccaceae bacterium]
MSKSGPEPDLKSAPSVSLSRHAPLLGIVLKLGSTLAFGIMVVLLKTASDRVPVGELTFARSFFGLWPVLIMLAFKGQLYSAYKTERIVGHLLRSIVGVLSMLFSFTAFSLLPLSDATAIGFASPLFVVVFASLILGETVRFYRWSAVIIGFVGILIILSPHLGQADFGGTQAWGASFALVAAVGSALAMIFIRRLCDTERAATIVTWFSSSAAVLSLATVPLGFWWPEQMWVMPDMQTFTLMFAMGIAGGLGQIFLTESYRFADASTIAPFDYTNMIWALGFGYILFGEVPLPQVLIGAAIVIAAGIFVIYREHRLGLDRTKNRRASTPSRS